MIPIGTPAQQAEPKHRRDAMQVPRLADTRDYPAHVCPGMHCAGRARAAEHRHTYSAVHTLTPEQAERADRLFTR